MQHVMPHACMWSAREADVDLELGRETACSAGEAKPVRSFACSLASMLRILLSHGNAA